LRARKTRGAFYDNFKDKDDVFLAIFEQDVARDLSELSPLLLSLPYIHQRIEALAEYLGKLSGDLERMLLNMEFKLYAIRHPHKRKRLADLLRAMRLQTSIPEITRLLPQLDSKTSNAKLTDCLAICGVMDGLALNHLFDPDGLDNRTLVRYLQLCLTETIPQIPEEASYSPRKASMGSVLEARLAGNADAASASSSIATAASVSTRGSKGLTANRKVRKRRDAAAAPSKPKKQPTAASFNPEVRISASTRER
jgi:AcrR family transcriptional regulator